MILNKCTLFRLTVMPKLVCDYFFFPVKTNHFRLGKNRKITLYLFPVTVTHELEDSFAHQWLLSQVQELWARMCTHSPMRSLCPKAKFYDQYWCTSASYVAIGWIKLCHYIFLHRTRYLQTFIRLWYCLAAPLRPPNSGIFAFNRIKAFYSRLNRSN